MSVKLFIDERDVSVPEGTNLIEAARTAGIEIPHYCYHPGLSVDGNCRMCMVEVEGQSKLCLACNTPVKEGMVVHTANERVKKARAAVLEFLLLNHPVDCPVCDQSGECGLQDYYMEYGGYRSRLNFKKIRKPKRIELGKHVVFDAERCILCCRCVRFLKEITGTGELGLIKSGPEAEISLHPTRPLDNPYSGNVIDICPVGALTCRDFRFQCRVWYLEESPSICPLCSRGCNIEIHHQERRRHKGEGRRIFRIKPRFHPDVNQWWICDEGRYGYRFIDEGRIAGAALRTAGEESEEYGRVKEYFLQKLRGFLAEHGPRKLAVIASPWLTNEELFLVREIFAAGLGIKEIPFLLPGADRGEGDDILRRAEKCPNSKGAEILGFDASPLDPARLSTSIGKGEIKGIVVFLADIFGCEGGDALKGIHEELELFLYAGTNRNATASVAPIVLPAAVYAENRGSFTNFEGRAQVFSPALSPLCDAEPLWRLLLELGENLGVDLPYEGFADISSAVLKTFHGSRT